MAELALRPGMSINTSDNRRWTVIKRLGGGTFGTCYQVFSAIPLHGHYCVAVKVASAEASREEIEFEAELMQRVEDKCGPDGGNPAVKLLQYLEYEGTLLIFMELMACTLTELLPEGGIQAAEVFALANKLLSLVGKLHHAGLAHLDLKEDNILVSYASQASMHVETLRTVVKAKRDPQVAGEHREALKSVETQLKASGVRLRRLPMLSLEDQALKLGDLGLTMPIDQIARFPGGTLGYKAPECIFGGRCTEKIDLFAIGVVVAQAAAGTELLQVVGQSEHEKEMNSLNQTCDLMGPVSQAVFTTVFDSRPYFTPKGVLKKRFAGCPKLTNLKRWVQHNVLEKNMWSQIDCDLLYNLLKRCLAINVQVRGSAKSVIKLL